MAVDVDRLRLALYRLRMCYNTLTAVYRDAKTMNILGSNPHDLAMEIRMAAKNVATALIIVREALSMVERGVTEVRELLEVASNMLSHVIDARYELKILAATADVGPPRTVTAETVTKAEEEAMKMIEKDMP